MRRKFRPRISLTFARKIRFLCIGFSLCFLILLLICSSHLRTLLANVAVTRVNSTVNRVVSQAVNDAVNNGDIIYSDLILFVKDNEGRVTALQSNIAEFNRLQAFITQDVLERLNETGETNLSIPLGTLMGSALLSGRGPKFKIKMQTIGSCTARLENKFTDAGINQTTHRILLYVDVSISILLPGFRTGTSVSNVYSVAETVIVGDVPENYTYFDSNKEMEDDAYEYSMNN